MITSKTGNTQWNPVQTHFIPRQPQTLFTWEHWIENQIDFISIDTKQCENSEALQQLDDM